MSEALYFDDPDGNGIEIARDRLASEWKWDGDIVDMATVGLDGDNLLAETNEAWKGMPEDTLMGHIHLHVSDLRQDRKFYMKGLGFDIVTRMPCAYSLQQMAITIILVSILGMVLVQRRQLKIVLDLIGLH